MSIWKAGKNSEIKPPLKNPFYSKLNRKDISNKDCGDAQEVSNNMEKKTLGFYHGTYSETDVLLLADVFDTFRNTCAKRCKLHPAHFDTVSRLTLQALLKTASEHCENETKRKGCELCLDEFRLELLRDIDMLLMLEKGIHGGITQASQFMQQLTISI